MEPLNKGHFGSGAFVLYLEAVPLSETSMYCVLNRIRGSFVQPRPILAHSGTIKSILVSAIQNPEGPLVGGCFNTKPMYFSIHAKVSVRCREVGRLWEGPLRKVPL